MQKKNCFLKKFLTQLCSRLGCCAQFMPRFASFITNEIAFGEHELVVQIGSISHISMTNESILPQN